MLSWKAPIRESDSWPCSGHPKNLTMCLRALPKLFLKSDQLGAVTTALGTLFQCSATL